MTFDSPGNVGHKKHLISLRNGSENKAYSKSIVFQNTYTNAEKLLAAAEELAQTGECNADDIYRWSSQNIFIWIRPLPDIYMSAYTHTQIHQHIYTGECNVGNIYRWISQNIFIYTCPLPDIYMYAHTHTQIHQHIYTGECNVGNIYRWISQSIFIYIIHTSISKYVCIYMHAQIYQQCRQHLQVASHAIYVEMSRNAYMKWDEIKSPHFGFKWCFLCSGGLNIMI